MVNANAQSLSGIQIFVTQWTTVPQTLLSIEFSRQEYWSGLPFSDYYVTQLCLTFCEPMECIVHGIL